MKTKRSIFLVVVFLMAFSSAIAYAGAQTQKSDASMGVASFAGDPPWPPLP